MFSYSDCSYTDLEEREGLEMRQVRVDCDIADILAFLKHFIKKSELNFVIVISCDLYLLGMILPFPPFRMKFTL